MNFLQKAITCLTILVLIGLGAKLVSERQKSEPNQIKIKIIKNEWRFSPENIKIKANQNWEIVIYNEDSYPHGFYIEDLGINQSIDPLKETLVKINTDKTGDFTFSCSFICGEGHYRMTGRLKVE